MSQFKGLGIPLSEAEKTVLSVFKGRDSVAYPVGCGLNDNETRDVLEQLTKKNIIKGRAPYRLTKLGRRLLGEP